MRLFWIPVLLLAASGVSVQAQETATQEHAVSIHGFGTVGYAQSRNPNAEFLRDLSQPTGVRDNGSLLIDSLVGLQASYRATDAVDLVAQVVSHQRYDDTFDPELTWAFVKYDMSPRISWRVGRLGTEFLMQSDSRMVGYSYLPVRPPVNFYGEVPINYGDGADVHFSAPLVDGVFNSVTHGTVLTENSRAGYVSIARRVGNVSPYLGYAWAHSDPKSLDTGLSGPVGDALNPMVQTVLQSSHQDQQTRTVGLRWDFARNLDLKAQFDFVSGDPSSILLYDHLQSGWDGHTTVFSLALDFVF